MGFHHNVHATSDAAFCPSFGLKHLSLYLKLLPLGDALTPDLYFALARVLLPHGSAPAWSPLL